MADETPLNPPAVFVDILDADGNVIAHEVIENEVADFLKLRVDPTVAAGCKVVRLDSKAGD